MMPFVPTPETFLALALCGSIQEKIVPPPILADFLLYHLNLIDPELYTSKYDTEATNDIFDFLAAIAQKTGRLRAGGYIDERGAAMEAISRFRKGGLGQWTIDRITPEAFNRRIKEELVARQRESRGSGDVVETKKSNKGGFINVCF
jgi:mitochondrial GTPase 1